MSDNGNQTTPLQTGQKQKRSSFFWRNTGILFSAVAMSVLVAVILVASYALVVVNHRVVIALTHLTDRLSQAESLITDAENRTVASQKAVDEINVVLKTQSQSIADLQKNQRTNRDDILMNEIFSRVKMANDSLQYESNIPMAIKWLRSADQEMATLTDPKMYPVRQALAADEMALQGVPAVDVPGIYARLSALNGQIDKLPLVAPLPSLSPTPGVDANNPQLPWWRRGLHSLRLALERIVIVRKNVPDAPPFIAPDQQLFLYQNLQAELETARWALLHRQPDIYRSSLRQALDWIKRYAMPDSPITKQCVQTLTELQSVEVRPGVPALTGSLQALQTYINNAGK
ncbi:MAG TPA: uroporphyrinogen-III C-methyltransferase [Gammaproteobacteria bacterium]|nr:uroporphyrinogen-III C-methyltransferase [Gammaproteobacteria bacterium]